MAVNISNEFHRTSTNPIDDSLTLTKAQMAAISDNIMPNKYFTICQDDGYIYLYDKSATASLTTGKFTKFEGGDTSDCIKFDSGDVIHIAGKVFGSDIIPNGSGVMELGNSGHHFWRAFINVVHTVSLNQEYVYTYEKSGQTMTDTYESSLCFVPQYNQYYDCELTLHIEGGDFYGKGGVDIKFPNEDGTLALTSDITSSLSDYLPLSGGTMSGRIVREGGGTYIKGRENAVVFGGSYGQSAGQSWNAVWSQKTTNGAWTAGNLSGGDILRLVYDTDTNYENNNNQSTYIIDFPTASGTIALTADLSSYLPLSGGTMTGSLNVNNINATDGNGMLAYKPSNWSYVSNTQWGMGATNCQGVIRTSNSDLIHNKGGTAYTIYDSSNFPKASSSVYGGAKIYASGNTLYITTT